MSALPAARSCSRGARTSQAALWPTCGVQSPLCRRPPHGAGHAVHRTGARAHPHRELGLARVPESKELRRQALGPARSLLLADLRNRLQLRRGGRRRRGRQRRRPWRGLRARGRRRPAARSAHEPAGRKGSAPQRRWRARVALAGALRAGPAGRTWRAARQAARPRSCRRAAARRPCPTCASRRPAAVTPGPGSPGSARAPSRGWARPRGRTRTAGAPSASCALPPE